ncbi:hypothetical protein JCM14469_42620 [Desulfatiferula olefinivorans]
MIDKKESLFLNSLAQGIRPIREGTDWFETLSFEKQLEILREISVYAQQAGVRESDVQNAIYKSGLKSTYTPCILVSKGNLKVQLAKVLNLPKVEYIKVFILLLSLLSVADERRMNNQCKDGCSHWWHQDINGTRS